MGINNHTYSLDLDYVSGLEIFSFGLFADITVFPFEKGLFTGIRWQMFSTADFPETSKKKFNDTNFYEGKNLTTGTGIYIQAGYHLPLSDKFSIRLTAQPGLQYFKVSNLFHVYQ